MQGKVSSRKLSQSGWRRVSSHKRMRVHKIIAQTGVQRTPVGSSWAYMYVCLSLRLSIFLPLFSVVRVDFWRSNLVARNCVQRMWPQAMGLNTLSGSIIFPSVHLYIHPSIQSSTGLLRFLYLYIDSQSGVQRRNEFSHTEVWRTPVGSSRD